jgi:hypothetical protein
MSSTFGNTTLGNTPAPSGGYIAGGHYQPAQTGPVADIQVGVQNTDTVAHNIQCALYAYLGPGNPGAFIAKTQNGSIPAQTTAIVKCPLPSGNTVNGGTDYFLMATSDDTNYTVFILYTPGGAAGTDAWVAMSPFGTWPSTLAGLCTSSSAQRTIYADYTPSGPTPPPVTTYAYTLSVTSGATPYQVTNVATGQVTSFALFSVAFNYLQSQGSGQNLDVLSGAYTVDATFGINGTNTSMNFEPGAVLTATNAQNAGNDGLDINANSVTITGLVFNGNGLNQYPGPTVSLSSVSGNVYQQIYNGVSTHGASNFLIQNSTIYNFRCFGIVFYDGNKNGAANCTVYNVGANCLSDGIPSTNTYFLNMTLYGCSDVGISFQGVNGVATGNTLYQMSKGTKPPMYGFQNSFWGIAFESNGGGTGNGNYALVANNNISQTSYGITLEGVETDYIIVSDNTVATTDNAIVVTTANGSIIEYNIVTSVTSLAILITTASNTTVYGNTYNGSAIGKGSQYISDGGANTIYTASSIVTVTLNSTPVSGYGLVSVNGTVTWTSYTFYATVGSNVALNAIPPSGYSFSKWSDGGAQQHIITVPNSISTDTVTFTTSITPTYILNWAITPVSGNLPFTITFSGYLSRSSSTPDTNTIVNGETIQLQAMPPGGTTWTNTGITEQTGSGPSGNGYFSGTWGLSEPTIYPGAWQFRAYYAGNTTKNLFGCVKGQKTRDLSRVNALIL